MFESLEIDIKRNILICIIDKLNGDVLKKILKFCYDEKIPITHTKKYYLFNIMQLNDLQIKMLWCLIMN